MRYSHIFLIGFLLVCETGLSRTLHVPTEYATIQSAFNELLTNDTVLVDSGLYVEELSAPGFSFVMMGNVGADTTGRLRPTIDPSGLSGPTGRGCLILSSGNVRIRDVNFRNSAPMYPHVQGDVGGISAGNANLILTRCRFDSVHYGIISYPDNGAHTIQLDHCDFAHASGRCVFAQRILAESCTFHSDTIDWAQLTFGSNTVINNCSFSGDFWGGFDSSILTKSSTDFFCAAIFCLFFSKSFSFCCT